MHLVIPLQHLGFLIPGLDPALPAVELAECLRGHFAFIADVQIEISGDTVRLDFSDPALAKRQEAERLAERAIKRAREGDFARAADLYTRVTQLHPTLPTAHRELAMCLMELGRLPEAKDTLIDALKLDPADAWSFVILGNLYAKQNDPAQARRFQQRALELKPGDPWALNGLAAAEMALGNTAAGLAHFAEATRLHPGFVNAWQGKALAELRTDQPAAADTTLRELFRHARRQDARSTPVFAEARRLFLEVQHALATRQESDAFKTTQALRAEVETLSGYPVDILEEKLPGGISGRAQMAWKHGAKRHRISIRLDTPPTCASPAMP